MKRTITTMLPFVLILAVLSSTVSWAEWAPEEKLINSDDIIAGFEQGKEQVKVIVNLTESIRIRAATNWNNRNSLRTLHEEIESIQTSVLSTLSSDEFKLRHRFENQAGFSGEVTLEGLAKLLNDPRVESIEPVYVLEENLKQGIPLINASVYRSMYNGQGVAIAICDSGIDYTHPKLGGGGFPNSKVIGGYDFGDNDKDPSPNGAHGSACAGIAAGDPNSPGEDTGDYIGGVAHGTKLYALKVNDSNGVIDDDNVIAALNWCITHKNENLSYPILAISVSLGSMRYPRFCDCVEREDFETGDFGKFQWVCWAGDGDWTITSQDKHSGTYSARAGQISNNEKSILAVEVDCIQGCIEFWGKVSCESQFDTLKFYIDSSLKVVCWGSWDDWGWFSYPVSEGKHVFIWVYSKDWSGSAGADTAWIDDIIFPARCPSAFAQAVNNAVAAGITVLAASGNDGYCDSISHPACLSNVISVGAVYDAAFGEHQSCVAEGSCAIKYPDTDKCPETGWHLIDHTGADIVPSYSNTAYFLDILAPANMAYTTDIVGASGYSSGDYHDSFGGTSAACPYAAGAVACLQSAAKARIGRYLSPLEVRDILIATGDNITDHKSNVTKPRINLGRAIVGIGSTILTPTVIFEDTFPSTAIDPNKWSVVDGATVDDVGINEPSAPYSLRLNDYPSGSDFVESKVMDLSLYSRASLIYHYQRTGGGKSPGAGKDLIIEYWDGWKRIELVRHPGEGPDMTVYDSNTIALPLEALHPGFKLRIRFIGSAWADRWYYDWFVDDVKIEAWR